MSCRQAGFTSLLLFEKALQLLLFLVFAPYTNVVLHMMIGIDVAQAREAVNQ